MNATTIISLLNHKPIDDINENTASNIFAMKFQKALHIVGEYYYLVGKCIKICLQFMDFDLLLAKGYKP